MTRVATIQPRLEPPAWALFFSVRPKARNVEQQKHSPRTGGVRAVVRVLLYCGRMYQISGPASFIDAPLGDAYYILLRVLAAKK